jgi:hypothetical protein
MSRRALDWVWANRGLAPGPRLVLLALAEHADTSAVGSAAPAGVVKPETGSPR